VKWGDNNVSKNIKTYINLQTYKEKNNIIYNTVWRNISKNKKWKI